LRDVRQYCSATMALPMHPRPQCVVSAVLDSLDAWATSLGCCCRHQWRGTTILSVSRAGAAVNRARKSATTNPGSLGPLCFAGTWDLQLQGKRTTAMGVAGTCRTIRWSLPSTLPPSADPCLHLPPSLPLIASCTPAAATAPCRVRARAARALHTPAPLHPLAATWSET
jgi:hypothetical protein